MKSDDRRRSRVHLESEAAVQRAPTRDLHRLAIRLPGCPTCGRPPRDGAEAHERRPGGGPARRTAPRRTARRRHARCWRCDWQGRRRWRAPLLATSSGAPILLKKVFAQESTSPARRKGTIFSTSRPPTSSMWPAIPTSWSWGRGRQQRLASCGGVVPAL